MLKKCVVFLVAASLVLTGCGATDINVSDIPTGIPTGLPPLEDILPPEVAGNILAKVSELVGVSIESMQLKSIEPMDWPNGCLGLPEANEICTEAITPGWLLVFEVNSQDHRFRADQTGAVIRREP